MADRRRLSRSLVERRGLDDVEMMPITPENVCGSKVFGHMFFNQGELPTTEEDLDAVVGWANQELERHHISPEVTRLMVRSIIARDF